MPSKDQAVRDAAMKLHDAIQDATRAGYAVAWPGRPEGLRTIGVSETAKVAPPKPEPVPTIKNPNPKKGSG